MKSIYKLAALAGALVLGGCVSAPTGPSVMAMPGSNKSYEQFREDEAVCQSYAQQATAGNAKATQDATVNSAAVGTVVGAVAGALIGAASHQAGAGAAIGAGGGLLVGSAAGSNASSNGNYGTQRRFDSVYLQCMYSKGNQIPSRDRYVRREAPTYQAPPPPSDYDGPSTRYYGTPPGYR
ncbi:glycine zipper family protein [Herbaspirillum sp. RTI4]|uniref:glycine zipper family protein n=1 Tax=Herbaspirillum sp. RTI4 TaxID=3048640 RepID=UPI002AB3CD6F|nr:glycine zipper family protein [Herbaspirillum sp. RTI4]MDY7579827.1 glycine zipper family protein [Herbaspirillum sp. RTI4]MEA9981914.1 glycine zipper family protein [Herbaspirillum sp. RTI4]